MAALLGQSVKFRPRLHYKEAQTKTVHCVARTKMGLSFGMTLIIGSAAVGKLLKLVRLDK